MNDKKFPSLIGQNVNEIKEFYKKMIEEPPEEFSDLKTNSEKIRFCYDRLFNNNMIVDRGKKSGKDEKLAIESRNKGNNFFIREKDYVSALQEYNKSICLSLKGSENIGICYANRSSIYFESGLYKLCLENIELALCHHYPDRLRPKLENRRNKCLMLMKNDNYEKFCNEKVPIKLSYPCNKRIPFIIEGLEYKTSKDFGRFIRTKHDLYPGDIVMIDTPYIKCVNEGSEYMKCNNCHQTNFFNLFPCEHCSKAMYCQKTCEQEAWARFHQYECQVIESDLNRLIIRATLVSFTLFNDCVELRRVIDSVKKKPITGFDLNFKMITEEDTFKAIYGLATNGDQRSTIDIFKRSNLLAQSWHMLLTHTKVKETLLGTTDDEDLFLDTLLHFSQLSATNSHELRHVLKTPTEKVDDDGIYSGQKYGSALFPFISLLNHSCASNVTRINSNGQICIMVLRHIKTGEQLFDNYGTDHINLTREQRQEKLSNYLFECRCETCLNDYPLLHGLLTKGLPKFDQIYTGLQKINEHDKKWALEYFPKCKKFLKEFGHHYPAYEVCAAQVILHSCRKILFENTPLQLQLVSHGNVKLP